VEPTADQETEIAPKLTATGVSTRMAAGAAITPGFGSTTDGFCPVARSSVAGFHAQTAESSSDSCRFTAASCASALPVTRARKGVSRSSATIIPSQGRSRSAERLACIATSRWRRLRSSSIFMRRWTVAAEVVSGNSMSRQISSPPSSVT